ncbi:MAG: acetate--CoA ligase family protein, partial [Desulfobacterales bacterium]|nr:acetate--CoA ligase family protein [Desulfobacterales bacterium]
EVIIGGTVDPDFGPVVMYGMGGIWVENLKDVSFCPAPVGKKDALEMIQKTKSYGLLKGGRGRGDADVPALLDALEKFSRLMADFPQIVEMDLNPLMLADKGRGAVVLDARIKLAGKGKKHARHAR